MGLWRWVFDRMFVTQGMESLPRHLGSFSDDTGESVTATSALNLSAWWSCTKLISETIATLPCGVFLKDGDGDPEPQRKHVVSSLLRDRPNDWQTPVEFWEGRVAPLCSDGNSYSEKKFIAGRLVALEPMNVDAVGPFRDQEDGWKLKYKFTDRGKTEVLPADKVFHIRAFGQDEIQGLSPVQYASRSIGAALAADRAAAKLYGRGLRAPGFWKPPSDMSKDQREQFVTNYVVPAEGAQGEGSARIVMPPGFEWASFGISPKDAELLTTRGFGVEDVCRWMGVPPILIGHASQGQTMWGSGVEQIILGWLVLGLRAYLKRIEAAVNARLLTDSDRVKGIYFEFNFEGLLRADSAGRAALMSTLAQNGLRTRNELRKLDNMTTLPGGDDLTVQSNLIPIEKLGDVAPKPAAPAAPDQKPGGEQAIAATQVRNAMRAWLLEEREKERLAA